MRPILSKARIGHASLLRDAASVMRRESRPRSNGAAGGVTATVPGRCDYQSYGDFNRYPRER